MCFGGCWPTHPTRPLTPGTWPMCPASAHPAGAVERDSAEEPEPALKLLLPYLVVFEYYVNSTIQVRTGTSTCIRNPAL
eukprot:COSAG02_NODE_1440_length_12590_cov_2.822352_9_plen_79_part_00